MSLFTCILDYGGGTYIEQVAARDVEQALNSWLEKVDLDQVHGLTEKSRPQLRARFNSQKFAVIEDVRNVWCISVGIRGKLALLNIVKTDTS
jgi:hypothetical protein